IDSAPTPLSANSVCRAGGRWDRYRTSFGRHALDRTGHCVGWLWRWRSIGWVWHRFTAWRVTGRLLRGLGLLGEQVLVHDRQEFLQEAHSGAFIRPPFGSCRNFRNCINLAQSRITSQLELVFGRRGRGPIAIDTEAPENAQILHCFSRIALAKTVRIKLCRNLAHVDDVMIVLTGRIEAAGDVALLRSVARDV